MRRLKLIAAVLIASLICAIVCQRVNSTKG